MPCFIPTTPRSQPSQTAQAVSTEETCSQLSDVQTILSNTRTAFAEGRLLQQEFDGAGRLATRMLGSVDVEPGTALADAVASAQQFAPGLEIYSVEAPPDFTSQEWYAMAEDLTRTCSESGSPIAVAGWVGG